MASTKEQLYQACIEFIQTKERIILDTIKSHQDALSSETKSSAGDKHETGRAMLQLEMEKASQQLEVVYTMKTTLKRIKINESSDTVKLGSAVVTDNGTYFLAISAGEFKINEQSFYAISAGSPLGKLLLGKRVGETLTFHKQFVIKEIY